MAAGDINDPLSNIPNIVLVNQPSASAAPGAGYGRLEIVDGVLGIRMETGAWVALASALTVAEVDGVPSLTPTTLQLPNGTLSDQGSGVARYTPTAVGGGPTLLFESTLGSDGVIDTDPSDLSGYRLLQIRGLLRSPAAVGQAYAEMYANNDLTASNYRDNLFQGGDTGGHGGLTGASARCGFAVGTNYPDHWCVLAIELPSPDETAKYKVATCRSGYVGSSDSYDYFGTWQHTNTAAITRLRFTAASAGSLASGSWVAIWGVA